MVPLRVTQKLDVEMAVKMRGKVVLVSVPAIGDLGSYGGRFRGERVPPAVVMLCLSSK